MDVDLDGYEDLLVTNGRLHDVNHRDAVARFSRLPKAKREQVGSLYFPPFATANVAYRNLGNFRFTEMGQAWGFNSPQMSHGIATGDLDNDGDFDLGHQLPQSTGPGLSKRRGGSPLGCSVARACAEHPGIGARVTVAVGNLRQTQEMIAGGRYLSGDQPVRMFAISADAVNRSIEVTWPSGRRSFISNPEPNHIYEVIEPSEMSRKSAWPSSQRSRFLRTRVGC